MKKKKVVILGGGTGSSRVLMSLKDYSKGFMKMKVKLILLKFKKC